MTGALGIRPKVFGSACFARATAASAYLISSSRLLNRYFGSVLTSFSSAMGSEVLKLRSPIRRISAWSLSICARPRS
jgi:hypothetical protein